MHELRNHGSLRCSEENHDFLIHALDKLQAPTFCCLGNHDLPVSEALTKEIESIGHQMLVDKQTVVNIKGKTVAISALIATVLPLIFTTVCLSTSIWWPMLSISFVSASDTGKSWFPRQQNVGAWSLSNA